MPDAQVSARNGFSALFSHIVRRGPWALPRSLRVAVFMGQANIDLTQVLIGPGVSEIEILCILGQVDIVAPHNLRIECLGDPVLGEFHMKAASTAQPSPDAPTIRIRGTAVAGSVKVKVVDPAVPNWWSAWRKRRERDQRGEAGDGW